MIFAPVMGSHPTIVITGGTRGVGYAIVELFAQKGWNVHFSARNTPQLHKVESEMQARGWNVQAYPCDLTQKEQIEQWASLLLEHLDHIHVLINNAGTFIPGKISEESDKTFEHLMALNIAAPYYLTKRILPRMMASGRGHIINIISTAGLRPYPNGASYCISKYALTGLTKVLREEMKPHNIRVTGIYPGPIYTDSWKDVPYQPYRFIRPENLAQIVWNACSLPPEVVIEDIVVSPQAGNFSESEMA